MIVSAVVPGAKQVAHEHSVEIARSIQESFAIDAKNGNAFWCDALEKEMKSLKAAFDILEEHHELPPGHAKASGHLVWDTRMTLARKFRWVKDGHKTLEPTWSTHAGAASRESPRISFTHEELNDLNVFGADIKMRACKHRALRSTALHVVRNLDLRTLENALQLCESFMVAKVLGLIIGAM